MFLSSYSRQLHISRLVMGKSADPVVPAFVLSSSVAGSAPVVRSKSVHRTHKKGNSSITSITIIGEPYWRSKAPKLVSLEVASQTPSIFKRGFEHMYHKSHGYRLTGGSIYFGPVSNLAWKSHRDAAPRGVIPAGPADPGAMPPPSLVTCTSSGPREKHRSTVAFDICGDSTKKVLKAAPLISLEEAKRCEVSMRNRAAERVLEKEMRVEREVRQLKREVAEVARKRAQLKREEEERLACLRNEDQEKVALETPKERKREREPTLTAAVAARKDGLVVAPTNWIVPLISLDEAQHTEKAKRDAADKSKSLPLPSPPPSAVASVDSLMINAGNGNMATLRLISLEEAAKRDRVRRLEEDAAGSVRSRTRNHAHAGAGLNHVSLITLAEARKQDALRRRTGSSQGGGGSLSPVSKSRKPSRPSLSSTVNRKIETGNGDRHAPPRDFVPRERARWIGLVSDAGNWGTGLNATPDHSGPSITRTPMGIPV